MKPSEPSKSTESTTKNALPLASFFIFFVLYEELIFLFSSFGTIHSSQSLLFILLFSIPVGLVFTLLASFLPRKGNIAISYLIVIFSCFLVGAQVIYYHIYNSILSFFSATQGGGQILQFIDMIVETILHNWYSMVAILLPILLLIFLQFSKLLSFEKSNYKKRFGFVLVAILSQVAAITTLHVWKIDTLYSPYNLYYKINVPAAATQTFGISTQIRLDIQRLLFGFEEQSLLPPSNNEEEVTPPQINPETKYHALDIDFASLANTEKNSKIKSIHSYMSGEQATPENPYTGIFEGKNLIVLVAEGFSSIAIQKDITPNLYKLYNEGFQFDNFYTPIFPVSTADGEYITDTSLIPKEGVWSLSRMQNNYMPYSYANVFKRLGYTTQAYHNHTYTYYDRHKYIKAMGYDTYLAKGNGLEKRINCSRWPNSDNEMMQVTLPDYIQDDSFLAYYMTVSGHLNYTTEGNYIANKNWSLVKDLPYSAKARSYLATQIELDRAVGTIIAELEQAGKLENTVIAISSDHYPYGLTLDEINELSTYTRDNTFEKYHMPFLVWNSQMKEPVKVDALGSSLDVLPTLLNLFGISYDSRLLIGTDILSEEEPLVIFSDRSFITDKGRYSSVTKQFTPNEGVTVEEGYVDTINARIYQKYEISKLILETNYYQTLKEYIEQ